ALQARVNRLGIRPLWDGAIDFLRRDYRPSEGLFSFSATVRNGELVQDFEHPQTRRYTINSLLGLQAAARATPGDPRLDDVPELLDAFLARHEQRVTHPGDLGLLTLVLCEA